jgi:hypothetical protein
MKFQSKRAPKKREEKKEKKTTFYKLEKAYFPSC